MNARKRPMTLFCLAFLVHGLVPNLGQTNAGQPGPSPLAIRGDTAVLVDCGDVYAVPYLQTYLMKYVAKHPEAERYALDVKPAPKRSEAPVFPVVAVSQLEKIPPGKVRILVGPCGRIPADFLTEPRRERLVKARPGAVCLFRTGDAIVLTSNKTDPWYLAPIRVFLDRCAGVRMYAPAGADGLEWVSMPAGDAFEVGELDLFLEPHFAQTTFSSGGHQRNAQWLRMNTIVSEGLWLRASHTVANFFPPDKYYAEHPQLYPMDEAGQRPKPRGDAWNPCLADPDLAAATALQEIRLRQPKGHISIGIMDAAYACKCPGCRDHNPSNLWFEFLNRVARQCRQEFPGLYITTYLYINIGLPQGLQVEPNIVVDVVTKSYHLVNPTAVYGEVQEVADAGLSYVLHDWNFQGCTPRIYSRQLAAFLQWGVRHNMKGIYTEWSGGEHWYLAGAYYWILHQLLSDPSQDTDLLWRQYCQDMFGAGWEEMYRFYDLFAQKHIASDKYHLRADWPRYEAAGFDADDVALQRRWLERAIALTKDDPLIQKRLAAVQRYFTAHELLVHAISRPYRLYWDYTVRGKQTGINRDALAFYVNDDAGGLKAFDAYYDAQRTVPPDSNEEDEASGIRFSYREAYGKALGTVFQSIRAQAIAGLDLSDADRETVDLLRTRMTKLYRDSLPAAFTPARADELERLLTKSLLVPRGDAFPQFDGDLSDAAWQQAAVLEGFTLADMFVPSVEGNETRGRMLCVGDSLVIGLECLQPKGIMAVTPPNVAAGSRLWRESSCEIYFGPPPLPGEKPEFAQYVVNALGGFRAFGVAEGNRDQVQVAARMAPDQKSFTLEFALPLKVAGRYDYASDRALYFTIVRFPYWEKKQNPRERLGWAPLFTTGQNPESRALIVLEQ